MGHLAAGCCCWPAAGVACGDALHVCGWCASHSTPVTRGHSVWRWGYYRWSTRVKPESWWMTASCRAIDGTAVIQYWPLSSTHTRTARAIGWSGSAGNARPRWQVKVWFTVGGVSRHWLCGWRGTGERKVDRDWGRADITMAESLSGMASMSTLRCTFAYSTLKRNAFCVAADSQERLPWLLRPQSPVTELQANLWSGSSSLFSLAV